MTNVAYGIDQPDSLEGWVAVKEDPFTCNTIPPRLLFLVSWNDVERKIAVTCRLRNRVVSDTEEHHGRSGLFSFQELRGIHDLLCLIHPSLGPYLPELPEESWGIWAYVSYPVTPENIDEICAQLQNFYFPVALETCKEQLLMSTMFEEHCDDEYFENISELRRQGYDYTIKLAEEELKNVLFERDNASGMTEMAGIYCREDTAIFKLNIALAELFNYLQQPFLDLREVACLKVREAKSEIQNPNNGERVRREFCKQLEEWQVQYEEALDTIQDNYIKYYGKTKQVQLDILKRLEEDRNRFGPTSFQIVAQERFYRVKEDYFLENLQFLHNKKKKYVQERDKVKEMIASMDASPRLQNDLLRLENEVFEWQIKIYDLHLDIFGEEERLAKTQKEAITRVIEDKAEQVIFYDAVENVDDIELEVEDDFDLPSMMTSDPRLKVINQKLKVINTKRAKLRTKKANLKSKMHFKENQKREEIERFHHHHRIQKKRERQKEEVEQKLDFIEEERRRTIDRLKTFRVKYPTPATIKPPRYQPPSQKRSGSVQTTQGLSSISAKHTRASKSPKDQSDALSIKDKKRTISRSKGSKGSGDSVDSAGDNIPVTIYVSGSPQPPIYETEASHDGDIDSQDSPYSMLPENLQGTGSPGSVASPSPTSAPAIPPPPPPPLMAPPPPPPPPTTPTTPTYRCS
ncbi:hypothetical protein DPMN_107875 [Dreissena polymorpha]|uniref:Uncharacterized protein n=1 Tax=Dreissena polymorpha TaxID=45954 RepID=A0A9D4K7H7_DREPO|nr:hypothetical protein DPMN_107875 [Dreissena polymorpha]